MLFRSGDLLDFHLIKQISIEQIRVISLIINCLFQRTLPRVAQNNEPNDTFTEEKKEATNADALEPKLGFFIHCVKFFANKQQDGGLVGIYVHFLDK